MNTQLSSVRSALKKAFAVTALLPVLLLTGCTPTPDDEPYFDLLDTTALETAGFTQIDEPSTSCGGSNPYCAQPYFEIYYQAPASTTPEEACTAFLATTLKSTTPVGYASSGYPAGPMPSDTAALQEFCVSGLGKPMPQLDGTVFYQGTLIYDDGASDEIAKTFTLSREPDGTYTAHLVFSRNFNLVYWTFEKNQIPAHMTLEQVERNNENLGVQVKVQEFANSLMQKTETEAIAAITEAGYTYHVFQRDQTEHPATGSNPTRILLNIYNGVVQDAMAG